MVKHALFPILNDVESSLILDIGSQRDVRMGYRVNPSIPFCANSQFRESSALKKDVLMYTLEGRLGLEIPMRIPMKIMLEVEMK